MRKKLDNRGSAMVIVIVVIAFVSVLVASTLTLSALNIQMKSVDRSAKGNFYSAEEALDQIHLGLQNEMSKAAKAAYTEVMQKFASTQMEVQRRSIFNAKYLEALESAFKDSNPGPGGVTQYDVTKLKAYLSDEMKRRTQLEVSGGGTLGVLDDSDSQSLVLKGLVVKYTDDAGYQSVIETDIRISIPNLNLVQPASMPDVFGYSIIANKGLKAGNSGTVNIGANVYAGHGGFVTDPDTSLSEVGLLMDNGAIWNFKNAGRVVVNGDVQVVDGSAITAGTDMDLWAQNLDICGGTLTTRGNTYVAGDMVMSGEGSKVTLSGAYHGFGNGQGLMETIEDGTIELAKAGESSAILINGTKTTLDMSGVKKLYLSGRAQIATGKVAGVEGRTNTDVNLGESLEVKSNQIAYLVPPECIGVQKGKTIIGRNPMTEEEYVKLLDCKEDTVNYPGFETVSFTKTVESLGKSLGEYHTPSDAKKGYQLVFLPISGGETLVYVYVDFDEENSAKYFREYYTANQRTLEAYMRTYVTKIDLNDRPNNISITADGNVIYSKETSNSLFVAEELDESGMTDAEKQETEEANQRRFYALGVKLMTDYSALTDDEKKHDVYTNLIRPGAMAGIGTSKEYQVPGTGITALVVNNSTGAAYEYKKEAGKNVCLILASGDVVLQDDFAGIVIAQGTVTVENNELNTITDNQDDLYKLLKETFDFGGGTPESFLEHFFIDGDKYILDSAQSNIGFNGDYIVYADYITYEGWTKK